MRIEYIVPAVLRFIAKMTFTILLIFVILNGAFFLFNYPLLNQLASLVQESVRANGYLPPQDKDQIEQIIAMYTANNDYNGDTGIPGVNKIITNLRIQVFDTSGNGYVISDGVLHSNYTNQDEDTNYYIGETGRVHKKQKGSVLFAGISCDYLILTPLNGWEFFSSLSSSQDLVENIQESDEGSATSDNWLNTPTGSAEEKREEIVNNSLKFNTMTFNNANTDPTTRSLFISPVITWEYYPDLENAS